MKTILLGALVVAGPTFADPAQIVGIDADRQGETWTFRVTLLHGDTGWDDYADGWRVEAEDGTVLGYRELFHPHVTEQPFTRSLSNVAIPDGTGRVQVRARTNVDGWDEATTPFDLPSG